MFNVGVFSHPLIKKTRKYFSELRQFTSHEVERQTVEICTVVPLVYALFSNMSPRNEGSDISEGPGSSTKGQMYFSLSPNLFKNDLLPHCMGHERIMLFSTLKQMTYWNWHFFTYVSASWCSRLPYPDKTPVETNGIFTWRWLQDWPLFYDC